jgi:hypothetical protein
LETRLSAWAGARAAKSSAALRLIKAVVIQQIFRNTVYRT